MKKIYFIMFFQVLGNNEIIVNSDYHSKIFWKEQWKVIEEGKYWKGEIPCVIINLLLCFTQWVKVSLNRFILTH